MTGLRLILIGVASALTTGLAGCSLIAYAAVAAEEAKRQTKVDVDAEYDGIDGHSFAVFVTADRVILAEHPGVVERFSGVMNERLRVETEATGYIPPVDLLTYMYNNPRWVARPLGEVAKEVGVDRLILVEIRDYRLYEPGNRYVWDGNILASVGVIEADSLAADEFVFSRSIRVRYPGEDENYTSDDSTMTEEVVQTIIESRFLDRVTWLFYDHKEPYAVEY